MNAQDALAAALHEHACGATHGTPWEFCFRDHKHDAAALAASGWTLAQPAPDPLRDALLDSLRVRTSDYNYRPLSDRERDLLAAQPAPDPLREAVVDFFAAERALARWDAEHGYVVNSERDAMAGALNEAREVLYVRAALAAPARPDVEGRGDD